MLFRFGFALCCLMSASCFGSEHFLQTITMEDRELARQLGRPYVAFAGALSSGLFAITSIDRDEVNQWIAQRGYNSLRAPSGLISEDRIPVLVVGLRNRRARHLNMNAFNVNAVPPGGLRLLAALGEIAWGNRGMRRITEALTEDYDELVMIGLDFEFVRGNRVSKVSVIMNGYTNSAKAAYAKDPREFGKLLVVADPQPAQTDGRSYFRMFSRQKLGSSTPLADMRVVPTGGQYSPDEFEVSRRFIGQPILLNLPNGGHKFASIVYNQDEGRDSYSMRPVSVSLSLAEDAIDGVSRQSRVTPGFQALLSWVWLGPYDSYDEIMEDPLYRRHKLDPSFATDRLIPLIPAEQLPEKVCGNKLPSQRVRKKK